MMRETPSIPKLSDGEAELQAQPFSSRECSFSCLPDSVIVAILSKVARADYLARCSATSKLIRDLARQVMQLLPPPVNITMILLSYRANPAQAPMSASPHHFVWANLWLVVS
eukprot:TRINITY_DN4503_c0_g3_i5.p2 TRINITY_DN4503_c0_g3~~TRINITY_DN4503_c0_g3_i5.p2  ORF type:complete len:112 (+),score=4.80 TRINITY_DN4503_c0_g3_i5:399-734(+)